MNFIYSLDYFLLTKATNKLIKTINKNDEYEVLKFSLIEDDFNQIWDSINTFSLFENKKIVLVRDCWFVNEEKVTLHKSFNLEKLEAMLKNANPETILIFTLNSDKFSKKLKIAKTINQLMQVEKLELMSEQTIIKYITTFFAKANVNLDRKLATYIYQNLPNDMQVINNELNKLVNLSQPLTCEVIKNNLTRYLENDIFEISNCFIKNDIDGFLKLYKQYLLLNDDLFGLIGLIGANVSFIRDVKILRMTRKSSSEIATILNAHPYRIKLAISNNSSKISQLNDKIEVLYKIHKSILNGKFEVSVLPEYEFVKNMRQEV
ncbi:DNA polymerase III subunit delta [Mesoplasma syrphidae]|uniref:DNA polymerase III subunit delta n=1 Tax=Mesoplasma syrphidae TaxID=225999 RepID=A0A2K9C991_9MOLU|nr:DNA polymerase III subunit delta [Mesoplasma syrphidae]AUF83595.1 DNA polymerase III subunit delta [Mesoplasma syrphidae]